MKEKKSRARKQMKEKDRGKKKTEKNVKWKMSGVEFRTFLNGLIDWLGKG